MSPLFSIIKKCLPTFPVVLVLLLNVSCATQQWAPRVGNYSYDQAVADYGPPDKELRSEDGNLVAEWVTTHSHTRRELAPSQPGTSTTTIESRAVYNEYRVPDYILELTFGPEGKLVAWKKSVR